MSVDERSQSTFEAIHEFWDGFQENQPGRMEAVLAPDVKLQDPILGTIEGVKSVVDVFIKQHRYPGLRDMVDGPAAYYSTIGFKSYEVYSRLRGDEAVVDRYHVEDGKITYIFSVRCNSTFRKAEGWVEPG